MDYRYMPFYLQGSTLSGMYYQPWNDSEVRDIDRLRELYPKAMQRIQEVIEEECDRHEFEGSVIYDQYPDKIGVTFIINRIFDRIKMEMENKDENPKYPEDNWVKDIIAIMLINEMYRRRMIRRNRRKYF